MFAVYLFVNLIGLTVYANYDVEGCDPLRAGVIDNSNQVTKRKEEKERFVC